LIFKVDNDEPQILRFNYKKVKRICYELARKVSLLQKKQKYDYQLVAINNTYRSRIHIERARMQGENRYSKLGAGGIFSIPNKHVNLYLNANYEKETSKFKIKKPYITFNYGADDVLKDGRVQNKMWPLEYHVELIKMLKENYKNIEIIQLGGSSVTKVDGADKYILGENLEIVKYLLKRALFHFDCEGGLVHMATQLKTKCFVIFGPTPVWYYGYEENTNFVPNICRECIFLSNTWYTNCLKSDKPLCVYEITPDIVFEKMNDYLSSYNDEYYQNLI
jgi:ADP-heptose:LPS heptosyltransferase